MEDYQIVDLYWERSERAIKETDIKYGRILKSTSLSLLSSNEDADECVNDTYLAAWNRMPDERPIYLGAFLSRIIRNISVSRYRARHREKRGGADAVTVELLDCIPDKSSIENDFDNDRLKDALNNFIISQSEEKRAIFIRRYFWSEDISEIAGNIGISESKVKTTLFRMRVALRDMLEREGLL